MKFSKTVCSFALLGIFCAGLAAIPGRGWATECEAYTTDAAAEDTYEPNNTFATATQLTDNIFIGAGGTNCGVMFAAADPADEYDYYKIVVPAGNTGIQVDLRFKYSLGDMTLRLYGTDGITAIATAATEFDNEYIDYKTPLAAGTYYIRVYSGQAGNNRYQLMAHVVLPVANYTVTPSVSGGNGSITPSSAQTVTSGNTLDFVLAPSGGYTARRTVTGTCPGGGWTDSTHYTTGVITNNCTAVFSFGSTKTVTSSAGTGGSVTPSPTQNVASGDTFDFTVTANPGYTTNSTVTGTCPQGSWDGEVYKTGAITANCTVSFGFTEAATHTVTPSAGTGGSFTPTGAQTVNHNATKAFTVTASNGYTTGNTVGGTCPQGSWNSNVYTTGAITTDCSVSFTFTSNSTPHTVTPSAGTGGSFTPTGAQTVNHNATKAFTVTASNGYTTDTTVGGTCPQGSWSSNVYTTGAIITDCAVSFTFTSNSTTHTVTPSAGTGGSFTPTGAQTVNHNTTKAFTVTASSGYTTDTTVGGTCPQGSWSSNVYTTGAITTDCSVSFSFTSATDTGNALPAMQLLLRAK